MVCEMAASPTRPGFRRYALAVQYHGAPFLGFSHQQLQENRILADGTDLRGYFTVESCLRRALTQLLTTTQHYDNLQVSSRTDRGVHALKNTLHVDISTASSLRPESIHLGINFYLRRGHLLQNENAKKLPSETDGNLGNGVMATKRVRKATLFRHDGQDEWKLQNPSSHIRVLAVKPAPPLMSNPLGHLYNQPSVVDWHARFSARSRTYLYRICHFTGGSSGNNDWGVPFEWDRSWLVHNTQPLDIPAMRLAAAFMIGRHDFSSFRAARCQRDSPVMNLFQIEIRAEPLDPLGLAWIARSDENMNNIAPSQQHCQLVTILFRGDSFLYRQVRNMTGCLLQVGRGKLQPNEVREILEAQERRQAPQTAPAHGLFLVNVVHEGLQI
jgi:tRNA pseudouridine(38-40) synthase